MRKTIIWLMLLAMLLPLLAACGKNADEPDMPTDTEG